MKMPQKHSASLVPPGYNCRYNWGKALARRGDAALIYLKGSTPRGKQRHANNVRSGAVVFAKKHGFRVATRLVNTRTGFAIGIWRQ